MPLETNLSVSPYFDDYDALKDYYRMLFKPGKSVQVRELNQLQQFGQVQTERLADNIFKRGTIIDGCNFTFHNDYPYIKIIDNDLDNNSAVPENYVGFKIKNSANLEAYIINSYDGFEATDPDLKTLYVNYTNSGNTANITSFSSGQTLTIFDINHGIYNANIITGSSGFSNSDTVIVSSALLVTIDSGSIANGDYICNPLTGANVQVIEADYNSYSSVSQVLVKIKPKNSDLANASVNSTSWTINQYDDITNPSSSLSAYVVQTIGSGLTAEILTNGIGKVTDFVVTNIGQDYTVMPYITVQSANNLTGINALNISPKDYYAKVKISTVANSVGSGYAFSVSEGLTYQQGHMLRVAPQTIIIDKYSNSPNNVVVGFKTKEEIVTANEDESLFDNCIDSDNYTAEGADRLKLVPELVVLESSVAKANTEFNVLVEWSAGQPYKQNKSTQYSRLGEEMAQRTFDESGNYVIDTFQIATTSSANSETEATKYTLVVDPGQAYISGNKVQTLRNYYIDVDKGLDTKTTNNVISLNYGNYVRIKEVGGLFQFSTGATVDLYTTAKNFLSNTSLVNAGNTTPQGTKIGTARCRSLILENGIPGDPSTIYRLFLFDVSMNSGKNFKDVKSIYYNGTNKGIADIVLTSTASSSNIAILEGTSNDKLIFSAGVESLKNSANSSYKYRTIDQTTNFGNNGILTKSIAAIPNEFYDYTGTLSDSQMKELYVVPIANTLTQYSDLTGTVSVNTTSAGLVGAGTSFFNDFSPGDYVKVTANATASVIKKVISITNSTYVTLDSNASFANSSCTFKRVFPQYVPIPFGARTGLSANVDANSNILTLTLAHANGAALTLSGTTSVNTAIAVNIKRTNVTSTSKTANRKKYVKFYCGNNAGNTVGPWALGVADPLRLRAVYVGNSSVNTSSKKISSNFYIDNNQNANYLDIAYLYKRPRSKYSLSSTDYVLVEFDYLTRADDGYFDTVSYLNTSNTEQIAALDSTALANLTSAVSSYEVPEIYTKNKQYYDPLNCLDFRPAVAATVTPSSDPTTAPLNPSATRSFGNTADPANDKKFPLPDASMQTVITQYMGRIDSVFIAGETGDIYVLKGIPDTDPRKRYPANHPKDTLKLHTISVPAYPNVTDNITSVAKVLLSTGLANERAAGIRWANKKITPLLSSFEFQLAQPMVYTMEDIANLERRIKDIEYYVSLSILETSITNKIIPSSIDRTLNRFKFGFFADDFSTDQYSDFANPQYAASFEVEGDSPWGISKSPLETETNWANSDKVNPDAQLQSPTKLIQKATNRITPPKMIWSMQHHVKNLPYIDEEIISQVYATKESPPVANTPAANTPKNDECVPKEVTTVVPSSNGYYLSDYDNFKNKISSGAIPSTVTFGARSGQATIYFNNRNSLTKYNVYKGTSLIASSNATANIVTSLTAADKSLLQSAGNETGFILPNSITNFSRSGDYVKNIGKLSFTHNHATGDEYIIVADSSSTPAWEFLVEYPLTAPTTIKTTIDPCIITNTVTSIKAAPVIVPYIGTIRVVMGFAGWSCSKQFAVNGVLLSAIFLDVAGLKPNTEHKFYLDGQDLSAWCELLPRTDKNYWSIEWVVFKDNLKRLGRPLISDPNGKLYMMFTLPMASGTRDITNASGWAAIYGKGRGLTRTVPDYEDGANWVDNVVTNKNKTFGSSGYSTLTISGPNSTATKLVAQRKPNSTIPTTPFGNP